MRHAPLVAVIWLSLGAPTLSGQAAPTTGQEKDNLAGAVVDPTAEIKTLTTQYKYAPSYWEVDGDAHEFDFQFGIPHRAFGVPNILRVTIPYLITTPVGNPGVTDVAVFDIVLSKQPWGTLAIGAVATFGPDRDPDMDTFAIGPAIGAILKKGQWTYGAFSQNFFSFGDIASTQLQPILAYTLSERWSFSLGDLQVTWDWNKGRFVNVPLSLQGNCITAVGEQPLRLFFNPQYNVKHEAGTRRWNLIGGVALIVR